MSAIIVLKIGSSVLAEPHAFERAALEIHGRVSRGQRVVAVVSALPGVTDALVQRAAARCAGDPAAAARLIAAGEVTSVRRLAAAVRETGLAVRVRRGRDLGLRVAGAHLDAEPCAVDPTTGCDIFDSDSVVVVPGFVGVRDDGDLALLGRGGSDLTALVLARALGAECRLLKDVDGLYEHDPNAQGPSAVRFACASWDTALARAGQLVQPKALHYARTHRLAFDIGAPFGRGGTHVGGIVSRLAPEARDDDSIPRTRVAMAGLGCVGGALWQRLQALTDRYEVVGVAVRRAVPRPGVPAELVTTDALALLERHPDVVVEAIGGAKGVAAHLVESALRRGIPVVTANKALVARRGSRWARAGAPLRASAAVGGGVPVVETVCAVADQGVQRLTAVLNGTTSFVLDRIAAGDDRETALARARSRGLAEADAGRDLDGTDARDKLEILIARAFPGTRRAPVVVTGIEGVDPGHLRAAARRGARVRLVAHAWVGPHGVHARIEPVFVEPGAFLAEGRGAACGIEVTTIDGRTRRVRGLGAGGAPTSAAIVHDLEQFARGAASRLARITEVPA